MPCNQAMKYMKIVAGTKFVCRVRNIQLTHDGTFKGKIAIQEIIEIMS